MKLFIGSQAFSKIVHERQEDEERKVFQISNELCEFKHFSISFSFLPLALALALKLSSFLALAP